MIQTQLKDRPPDAGSPKWLKDGSAGTSIGKWDTRVMFRFAAAPTLLAFACLISLQGCVPRFYTYHYMSLEGIGGIEVTERGEAQITNLFLHEAMPLKYRLARDTYDLVFEIPPDTMTPGIRISATARDGSDVRVVHSRNVRFPGCMRTSLFDQDSDKRIYRLPDKPSQPFGIGLWWSSECGVDGHADARFLPFDIIDGAGQLLARESLPFEFVANGFFMELDSV